MVEKTTAAWICRRGYLTLFSGEGADGRFHLDDDDVVVVAAAAAAADRCNKKK